MNKRVVLSVAVWTAIFCVFYFLQIEAGSTLVTAGFLSGLFKKKPGGTFFGNLLRGVSSTLTGGVLGDGGNRIEVGQTKTNDELAEQAAARQAAALSEYGNYGGKGSPENPIELQPVPVYATPLPKQTGIDLDKWRDDFDEFKEDVRDELKGFVPPVEVKADNSQLVLIGLGALALMLVMKK